MSTNSRNDRITVRNPKATAVNPEQLRFAKTHEWVYVEPIAKAGKSRTIGVSAFAVEALTDLVFIELPEVGRK